MIWNFLLPLIGIFLAIVVTKILPKAKFHGYDLLPFFFIPACQLITLSKKEPSFLPYGFLLYFILVVIVAINFAVKNKNISLSKTFKILWNYLTVCSIFWYIGLIFLVQF